MLREWRDESLIKCVYQLFYNSGTVKSTFLATTFRNAIHTSLPRVAMDSDSARAEKKRIENKKKRERRAAKQAASSVDADSAASAADSKRLRVDAAASDADAQNERAAPKSKALDIWDAHTVCDAAAVTPNGMRKPREFTQPLIVRAALAFSLQCCSPC